MLGVGMPKDLCQGETIQPMTDTEGTAVYTMATLERCNNLISRSLRSKAMRNSSANATRRDAYGQKEPVAETARCLPICILLSP